MAVFNIEFSFKSTVLFRNSVAKFPVHLPCNFPCQGFGFFSQHRTRDFKFFTSHQCIVCRPLPPGLSAVLQNQLFLVERTRRSSFRTRAELASSRVSTSLPTPSVSLLDQRAAMSSLSSPLVAQRSQRVRTSLALSPPSDCPV